MKKKATLELVEQSEKVSLYSISFAMDKTTEFELFLQKFESEASLNEDYQKILLALSLILGNGDIKTTAKYEEDKRLFGYALDLQKFNKLLSKDLEDGVVTVEERTLTNIEDKTYLI